MFTVNVVVYLFQLVSFLVKNSCCQNTCNDFNTNKRISFVILTVLDHLYPHYEDISLQARVLHLEKVEVFLIVQWPLLYISDALTCMQNLNIVVS